jgi:hypothetical protein
MSEFGLTSAQLLRKGGATLGSQLAWNGEKWVSDSAHTISSALCNWSRTIGSNLTDTGGSMATPGTQTLTFTKGVPQGVSGSNTRHYVYISGGTGTPEVVLITGGSAVSGASSGTITFTTANAHSGSWTISSATAGIQEALNSLPTAGYGGGTIKIPTGTHNLYATITIARPYTSVRGACRVGTTLHTTYTSGPMFYLAAGNDQCSICDLDLEGPNDGSLAYAIDAIDQAGMHVRRVSISGIGQGISITGNTLSQGAVIQDVKMASIMGNGAYVDTTIDGGTWERVEIYGGGSSSVGFRVRNCVGMRLVNTYTNSVMTGMWIDPQATVAGGVILMTEAYFDGYAASWSSLYGLRLSPASGGTFNAINMHGGAFSGFGYGMLFDGAGTLKDVLFSGVHITGNSTSAATINHGDGITFTDCFVEGNAIGLQLLGGSNIRVRGGRYAAGGYGGGINSQTYGVYVQNTTDVSVSDLIATPNTTGPVIDAGGNTRLEFRNISGYNPVGVGILTPDPSPWTYTAGPSPEVLYVYGGTITSINKGGAGLPGPAITLAPNQSVIITYSVVPSTVVKDVF